MNFTISKKSTVLVLLVSFSFMLNAADTFSLLCAESRKALAINDFEAARNKIKDAGKLAEKPVQKEDIAFLEAEIEQRAGKIDAAVEILRKIAGTPDFAAEKKALACFRIADIEMRRKNSNEAIAALKKIDSIAGLPVKDRANAKIRLSKMYPYEDPAPALKTLDEVLAIAELPIELRVRAMMDRAAIFERSIVSKMKCKEDGGIGEYENILKLDDLTDNLHYDVCMELATACRNRALEYKDKNDPYWGKAIDAVNQSLSFAGANCDKKKRSYGLLATWEAERCNQVQSRNYLEILLKNSNPGDGILWYPFRTYALTAENAMEYEEALWAWQNLLPMKNPAQRTQAANSVIECQARLKMIDGMLATAKEAAVSEYTEPKAKLNFSMLSELFGKKDLAFKTDATRSQLRNGYDFIAKCAYLAGDYEHAKRVIAYTDSLEKSGTLPEYHICFNEQSLRGVEAWRMALAGKKIQSEKEPVATPYDSANIEDIITADTTAQRTAGRADSSPETETAFYMSFDDSGIYLFVDCKDPDAQNAVLGNVNAGSLENIIAPGEGQPYFIWGVDLKNLKDDFGIDFFSQNRDFRHMKNLSDNQTGLSKDGISHSAFLSWLSFYDKLPKNGDRWPLSIIRWTRKGGITWHGKAHALNNCGRIVWNITPAQLTAIKRKIVLSAWAQYKENAKIKSFLWQDDVQGDPAFYQKHMASLCAAIEKNGARVSVSMSDRDVNEIYDASVKSWMEFDYILEELRNKYLQNSFFKK